MDMEMQLGPFDQAPYVSDKDNPWRQRDLLGWRRVRAYTQVRRLPPLFPEAPGVEPSQDDKRVRWTLESLDDSEVRWPAAVTLLGCQLAAALSNVGIDAEKAAKPLDSGAAKPLDSGAAVGASPSMWQVCEERAIKIVKADDERWEGMGPLEVWDALIAPDCWKRVFEVEVASRYLAHGANGMSADMWLAGGQVAIESEHGGRFRLKAGGLRRRIAIQVLTLVELIVGLCLSSWVVVLPSVATAIVESDSTLALSLWYALMVLLVRGQVLLVSRPRGAVLTSLAALACALVITISVLSAVTVSGVAAFVVVVVAAAASTVVFAGDGAVQLSFVGVAVFLGFGVAAFASSMVSVGPAGFDAIDFFVTAVILFLTAGAILVCARQFRYFKILALNGAGLIGYWSWGRLSLAEAHLLRCVRIPAEVWLDERLELAATGAIGSVLGVRGMIPVPESPGLVELNSKTELVSTLSVDRAWDDLRTHRTVSLAVVGERGLGKTAVVSAIEERCKEVSRWIELDSRIGIQDAAASIRIIVPGDYRAPDFVAYVAREIAQRVRAQVGGAKNIRVPRIGGVTSPTIVAFVYVACAVGMTAYPIRGWWGVNSVPWVMALVGVGLAVMISVAASALLRSLHFNLSYRTIRQEWRLSMKRQKRLRKSTLRSAEELILDMRWLRKLSSGASSGLTVGAGRLFGGMMSSDRREERTALTMTYAEIVRRTRLLLREYSAYSTEFAAAVRLRFNLQPRMSDSYFARVNAKTENPGLDSAAGLSRMTFQNMLLSLVVMVDEMDKLPDDDRITAINHIKDLFRIDHVKFVVTIADDYNRYRFMRYACGSVRNPYDSAFDDIIEMQPCDPLTAVRLFTRRVRGFPAPLALLSYIIAAGHPRDMIRVARSALDELRKAESRISGANHEPAAQRMLALKEAVKKVCDREVEEFSALLRKMSTSRRPVTLAGESRDETSAVLPSIFQDVRDRMSNVMVQTGAFVNGYAENENKGWATPDLIPGERIVDISGESWRALRSCVFAASLATRRLDVVYSAQRLADSVFFE